jgi:drug/metabolite transporter (DMT)-like permease
MSRFFEWFFSKPYLLLVLTTLFWGGNAIAGKLAVGQIPPATLTFLRWVATCLVFYTLARHQLPRYQPVLKKHILLFIFLGTIGYAFYNQALYGALNYTSAINVTIEQSGIPMVILLGVVLIYREKITLLQMVGAMLSVLGVIVTATRGHPLSLFHLNVNFGDALMLLGVLFYATYSIALRHRPGLPAMVFMFVVTAVAAIASFPFALYEYTQDKHMVLSLQSLLIMLYIIVFPSVLAQAFYVRGVELIGAGRAGLFINLVPVFGSLLAVTFLNEAFEPYHAMGLGLVIGGIGMAEFSGRRRALRSTPYNATSVDKE